MQKQRLGLNALVCAALLALLLCGCADATVEPPPAAAPLPRSVKGYELYSWRSGGTWQFTLITGTNRLKTYLLPTTGVCSLTRYQVAAMSCRRSQPRQRVVTPGSPSDLRPRKPPSCAIQRTA